jgi:hypothetical protein
MLKLSSHGYIDDSSDDSGAQVALSVLRQFVGFALATKLMIFDSRQTVDGFADFKVLDKATKEETSIKLPVPVSSLLMRVMLPGKAFVNVETPKGSANRIGIASDYVDRVAKIEFAFKASSEDGRHLRTAAEWLFDSEAESNETTALLFVAIGLEAALNSPAKETSNRMGDRLAWSLGRSLSDRNKMLEDFSKFYSVRCDLAHGRERQLDVNGRKQLEWGREMLRRLIVKELERSHASDVR